jgi:isoleucyl-tRNA synthetase
VATLVEQNGVELWETIDVRVLVGADFACPTCASKEFKKENDILDVWFDAGVSHTAVQIQHPEVGFPLDLYLEGKDQHRGYFQSALLTSIALHNRACMNAIITHGFTVDAMGKKMSKSLGNGISPQELIEKIGTDCVRLWAASIDLSGEAVVSDVLINNLTEVYRKVRNTCRFLLSNIYDFEFSSDAIPVEQLTIIDTYALYELHKINTKIKTLYDEYNFTAVSHTVADYITALSSFYLDIIKDRLYVEQASGHTRRSAQTVCYYILDTLAHAIAPILSILAEQLTDCYQKSKKESVHLQKFVDLSTVVSSMHSMLDEAVYTTLWEQLKTMRSIILKAIEQMRQKGDIKHSLETRIELFVDEQSFAYKDFLLLKKMCQKSEQLIECFIAEFCIVSQVILLSQRPAQVTHEDSGVVVYVEHARGVKCPRCWQWQETTHTDGLCRRCQQIVR